MFEENDVFPSGRVDSENWILLRSISMIDNEMWTGFKTEVFEGVEMIISSIILLQLYISWIIMKFISSFIPSLVWSFICLPCDSSLFVPEVWELNVNMCTHWCLKYFNMQLEAKILGGLQDDLSGFLIAVDNLKETVNFLCSSGNSKNNESTVHDAHQLLCKAMQKLEQEFKCLLAENRFLLHPFICLCAKADYFLWKVVCCYGKFSSALGGLKSNFFGCCSCSRSDSFWEL